MDRQHLAVRMIETVTRYRDRVATRSRIGETWVQQTFFELGQKSAAVARRLVTEGVGVGDRVAVFSVNRPEWTEVDYGILRAGAVVVPIYPTSTPDQVRHILADSGAEVLFCEGASEIGRLLQVWDDLPGLRAAVTFDEVTTDDERVRSYADLLAADHGVQEEGSDAEAEVERRLAAASGTDLASIIYTSGTTGEPRGAMLRHEGFTFQMDSLDQFFTLTPEDHSLCFLPLSHALERAWTFYILGHGCMNTYTDARKVAEMLVLAEPTLLVSVPRLFEKVVATAYGKVAKSPAKAKIFDWALRVGGQCQRAYRKGKQPAAFWKAQLPLADKLVLKSVRDAMGGPKTVMACGGAPLREEVEEFFSACGMQLFPGYGLTESSPLVSFNSPSAFKLGTVGRVVVGGEVRIGPEGEIWYRGPNVMSGYWNNEASTTDVLDAEGWLHTGDVGYLDTDDFLVITDRIKDLIVTSNGKNIAPAPIESVILADPLFEQAVILGDNRPYLTVLVSPSMPHLEDLATQLQVKWSDRTELLSNPQIVEEVRARVGKLTEKLAQHEQVKDLRLLIEEFTMDNGLLTPTLKVKRREVEKRFRELIDDMYNRIAEFRAQKDAAEQGDPKADAAARGGRDDSRA